MGKILNRHFTKDDIHLAIKDYNQGNTKKQESTMYLLQQLK